MIGDRGLCDLAERYGAAELADMMAGLLDHTERLLRNEIAAWPDGTVEFTDFMDSDGIDVQDVPLTVRLTIRGDELIADFTQSAPMVRGALNCTPSFVEATVYHTVMAASATHIPPTGGATRPITVVTKPGTVTHVVMPGASSMRGVTGYRLSDVMNGALAQLVPHRVPAAGEGGSTLAFFAGQVADEPFLYSEIVVGTWGGRPIADGNDGLANPCASIANISIEVAESNWPILIERYGLVPDSGGAGRFRGGLAVARVWRATVPDDVAPGSVRPTSAPAVRAQRRSPRNAVGEPAAPRRRERGAPAPDVRRRTPARRRLRPQDAGRRRLGRSARPGPAGRGVGCAKRESEQRGGAC